MKKANEIMLIGVMCTVCLAGCGTKDTAAEAAMIESTAAETKPMQETTYISNVPEQEETIEDIPEEKVIWNDFERVDYAAMAAILYADNSETYGCELLDLDNDEKVELVYVRENLDYSPRQEVYVVDLDNQPEITYMSDISPNGIADIYINDSRLHFDVSYAGADYIAEEAYLWQGSWINVENTQAGQTQKIREVANEYASVTEIAISNGDFDEIVKQYREHLDKLNFLYDEEMEETASGEKEVVFRVEDYAAPWKKDFTGNNGGYTYHTFSADAKDGLSTIRIVLDKDDCVYFRVSSDITQKVLIVRAKDTSDEGLREQLRQYVFYEPSFMDMFFVRYVFREDGTWERINVNIDGTTWGEPRTYTYRLENGRLYIGDSGDGYFYNEEKGFWQTDEYTYYDDIAEEYGTYTFYLFPYNGLVDMDAYDTMIQMTF